MQGGRSNQRAIRWAIAAVLAAVLLVAAAPTALGSTWQVMKLADPAVRIGLYGVNCPSTELCVAVGGNGAIAASANPAGGAGAWRISWPGSTVGDVPPGSTWGGDQIRDVSCSSAGRCVAVSYDGRVFSSTDPAGGGSAWKVVSLSEEKKPRVHMGGVSCPTSSLCVAVAYAGKIAVSTNPTGGRSDWTVVELSQPYDLRGVSCPTVVLCVAVGNEGSVLVSTDPTGGPSAWNSMGRPAGEDSINGISCPSSALCVTGSAGGVITSTSPAAGPGAWRVSAPGTGLPIKDASCASSSACAAIDNNADVLVSSAPAGGASAWWFKNVLPFGWEGEDSLGNGMFGISCPATSLCVGVGQDSQVIVSRDPFARDTAKLPTRIRKRLRRPRVIITHHPPKRLKHRGGRARATFRFRAIGRARRFICKIDRRRFRRCRSPRRYRVGAGRHRFRVRAIGPAGKGPPATFHFRVGGLLERPPAGSCPPGVAFGPCVPNRP